MPLKATFRPDGYARIPRGFHELKKGEPIRASDRFLKGNKGPWVTRASMEWEGGDKYDPHTKHKGWGHHTHIRRIKLPGRIHLRKRIDLTLNAETKAAIERVSRAEKVIGIHVFGPI